MDNNEMISHGELGNLGESGPKLKNNGAYHVEDKLLDEMPVSPSVTVVSGIGSTSSSPFPVVHKRQGLKKWRRIPRELAKKSGSDLIIKQNIDLTVSPVREAMLNVNDDHPVQPDFAIRADSDRSSSADISNLNGDDAVSVLPDDDQRNGRSGPGKKPRGFKTEKENSNSSSTMGIMGSDSGSSNFVFVQGGNTVAGKGRQSSSFAKHVAASSDDKDLSEKAQTGFIKSDAESDDVLLAADNNIEKHEGSMEHDPLVESIEGLHSAQEEFGREVQKWKDVGKDDPSIFNDPIQEILELKDARISELELALSSVSLKTDLEDCLMKIIQAEVENVVLSTSTKQLTEGPLRKIKHNLQENVASQCMQATGGTLKTKDNLKKLQHKVCRFTSCFMIQLILLLLTLHLKFTPEDVEVVPT